MLGSMRSFLLVTYIACACSLRVPTVPNQKNRRSAIFSGAAALGSLATMPAFADDAAPAYVAPLPTYEDPAVAAIAARANAEAKKSIEAKEKAKQGNALLDAAGGGLNVVLTGAVVLFVGGAGAFITSLDTSGIALGQNDLEERRPLTTAEKQKYAKLTPQQKRDLGIKGL